MMIYDVIVIGAGASGIVAAITASKNGKKVLLLERNSVIGKKLALTGNGRCNLTHSPICKDDYYGSVAEHFMSFYNQFNEQDLVQYFSDMGLLCKNKNGYIYPYAEQASVVVDLFMSQLLECGVEIVYKETIRNIVEDNHYYTVCAESKNTYHGKSIIIAVGGKANPKTGSDGNGFSLARKLGINMKQENPALVAIQSQQELFKKIAGVRWEGKICLYKDNKCIAKECGELQFANYGISGIPAFQISRFVSTEKDLDKLYLEIDFFPEQSAMELRNLLEPRFIKLLKRNCDEMLSYDSLLKGLFQKKIADGLFECLPLCKYKQIKAMEDVERIIDILKHYRIKPSGTNSFDQAQVTAGGILMSEIDEACELKKYPNIYVVGELLDIDGKCGGYNLQWAFMSGIIAARAICSKEM